MNLIRFAENLKELIEEKNISQKELANSLNVETSSVCRYLQGNCEPNVSTLVSIADYFNCPVDFLVGLIEYYSPKEYFACDNLGLRIKYLITSRGYTGYSFCKALKLNEITYYRWINGKRKPTIDYVIKIAKFFNCSVDYVLEREL